MMSRKILERQKQEVERKLEAKNKGKCKGKRTGKGKGKGESTAKGKKRLLTSDSEDEDDPEPMQDHCCSNCERNWDADSSLFTNTKNTKNKTCVYQIFYIFIHV